MKQILVTGGTGFLGSHLVEQLRAAESDARLRLLCRGPSPWDAEPTVEVVRGDITSPEDVDRALVGVDEVYHTVGVVVGERQDTELVFRVRVEGVRNLCEAALKHGVRKLVVVSESSAIGVDRQPVAHDERSGYRPDLYGDWPMRRSGMMADQLVTSYFAQHRLPVVVVNPSHMLGPGGQRSSTRQVAWFLSGRLPLIPPGGMNVVDVRDVAAAMIVAMRVAEPGERYLLGAANWSFHTLAKNVARVAGVRARTLRLPLPLSLVATRVMRRLPDSVARSFPLDATTLAMGSLYWYCDSTKARRELGFRPRHPLLTLKDTVDDLRRRGEVRT